MSSRTGKSEAVCSVAWLVQNGRSKVQRTVASDGFVGDYPYAGVIVVGENRTTENDSSASIFVETVRDIFAEGVAFGVEDALKDSFTEANDLIINKNMQGCSGAAIAYSGTHLWYALSGSCRIYRIDQDGIKCIVSDQTVANSSRLALEHPDFNKKVHELKSYIGSSSNSGTVFGHARVKEDTTYIVLTAGGWIQLEKATPPALIKGVNKSLSGWLSNISRDLKLAYRRQGGGLACVSGMKPTGGNSSIVKYTLSTLAVIVLLSLLIMGDLFTCNSEVEDQTDLFASDSIEEEIVQPLNLEVSADSAENTSGLGLLTSISDSLIALNTDSIIPAIIDISESLPIQIVQIGGVVPELNSDTFSVSMNIEPDIQWENFSPGIYTIRTDSVSLILAEIISEMYPSLDVIELDRIITVRETGVAESATWLSSLPEDAARSTGVIVETRSSVAGGADWIRTYSVFSNGNRADRSGETGGFMGDSLPGLPVLRNSNCYRLIIIP